MAVRVAGKPLGAGGLSCSPMRILLWHGYLLRGSGSNIYKANVVRAWRALGHDVLLLCQERNVEGLDFVDGHGDFAPDNSSFDVSTTGNERGTGSVTLVRPAIGSLLPVYVYDEYEGFTAKRYVDLTEDELQRYVDANVAAMKTGIERLRPEAIFTSHEVMGPYIALRAGEPYVAQLHGSALEYAVKEQERYLPYAIEGLNGAAAVTGGSEYMIEAASAVVPGWRDRAEVVNPGCDVDLFRPLPARANDPPIVGYVGKFIVQKGVHNLLAALPLIATEPVRAVIVGFGDLDDDLRALWDAVQRGDSAGVARVARDAYKGPLEHVLDLSASGVLVDDYFERARNVALEFTGRLDHGPLSRVLPSFDVLVVPSVLPEAFGMVAAEAAACGVLPVVPGHSGIGEAGTALERALDHPGLLVYPPGRPIEGIAARVSAILDLGQDERASLAARAVALAHERWAWSKVAASLLEVAANAAR
jgi:glycosyltransferase involved in cell wall biosynthesis